MKNSKFFIFIERSDHAMSTSIYEQIQKWCHNVLWKIIFDTWTDITTVRRIKQCGRANSKYWYEKRMNFKSVTLLQGHPKQTCSLRMAWVDGVLVAKTRQIGFARSWSKISFFFTIKTFLGHCREEIMKSYSVYCYFTRSDLDKYLLIKLTSFQ